MKTGRFYLKLTEAKRQKRCLFSILVDPDKFVPGNYKNAAKAGVSAFLVGGSLLSAASTEKCIHDLKKSFKLPVLLFPGNASQFNPDADGIFFLSLISGRNADFLIGQHVHASQAIRRSRMEVIPTGYMLVGGKHVSSTQYISGTLPIPGDKHDIACSTALAGELLGLRCIYLEGGSGSPEPVAAELIKRVVSTTELPVICGGGIDSGKAALVIARTGCSMIVVGNAIERNPKLIDEIGNVLEDL